jgi:hypothetical protein
MPCYAAVDVPTDVNKGFACFVFRAMESGAQFGRH